jgi:hypothetical protein
MHFEDLSMKGAHEREIQELGQKGKLKEFGTPGTGTGSGKPLPSPTHFVIKPGNNLAYLSWDAVPGAEQYLLYISEDGKNYKRRVYSPLKKTSIIIGNLTNGKTYYFAISAFGNEEGLKAVQTVLPVGTDSGTK